MSLGVAAVQVRIPLARPFTTSRGRVTAREAWLVRLRDQEGREGVGEAVLDPFAGDAALGVLGERLRWLVALLEGADGATRFREPALAEAALGDPDTLGAPGRAARAAVEAALVDGGWLALEGVPASEGHGRQAGIEAGIRAGSSAPDGPGAREVRLNATIDAIGRRDAVRAAKAAVARGFMTLKLKATATEPTDALAQRVAAIRGACGPTVRLRLDANGAWDLPGATTRMEALAAAGLEYVEQPVATLGEMAELRRRSSVPIAADELVVSPGAAVAVLDAAAADALVVKSARVGGPVVALRIARAAAARDVPVTVSNLLESGVGLGMGLRIAAALGGDATHAHGLATGGLLSDDLVTHSPRVRAGSVRVPWPATEGQMDDEAVRRHTVASMGSPW